MVFRVEEEVVFGRQLATARKNLGLTQVEAAARARISAPHLSHLEKGVRRPTLETVAKLAKALDLIVQINGHGVRVTQEIQL